MRALFAAGGTSGHIQPALATAAALLEIVPSVQVSFVGTDRGAGQAAILGAGFSLDQIAARPMPRKFDSKLVGVLPAIRDSVKAAGEIIEAVNPDVVVGFGGYVAAPVYLAAKRARLPLVIHEANAKAGWANRMGAKLTKWRAENYPGSLPAAELVGMPIKNSIVTLDRKKMRRVARETLGFEKDRTTLLVTGGSQGAQHLNQVTYDALPSLKSLDVDVLHLCGESNLAGAPADDGHYRKFGFLEDMALAYAASDLICCRAGATTVAEVALLEIPAMFVPLPVGNGEQSLNARPLVAAGLAAQVANSKFRAEVLVSWVSTLSNGTKVWVPSTPARQGLVITDAAQRMAHLITRAVASSERSTVGRAS